MAKIGINNESFVELINQVRDNIQEERNLALDRYKTQDENLDSDEQFALQGKILCDLLKIAGERSNALLNIGKMIGGIVYKDANLQTSNGLSEEDIKEAVKRQVQNEIDDLNFDTPDLDSNK